MGYSPLASNHKKPNKMHGWRLPPNGVPVADSPAEQVQRTGAASLITKMTDLKVKWKICTVSKVTGFSELWTVKQNPSFLLREVLLVYKPK